MRRALLLTSLLLVAAGSLAQGGGDGAGGAGDPDYDLSAVAAEPPSGRSVEFSHAVHTARRLKVKCVDCHRLGIDGNRFRPSQSAVCTPCHIEDGLVERFQRSLAEAPAPPPAAPIEPIHRIHLYYDCDRCHEGVRYSERVGDMALPPTDNSDEACVQCHARAVRFSHAQHVGIDRETGQQIADCSRCHARRPDGIRFSTPGHPQCWQCHDISLLGLTAGCNLCHLRDARAPKTYDLARASILHGEHDRQKIRCESCHQGILAATSLEQVREIREFASAKSCTRSGCHVIPR